MSEPTFTTIRPMGAETFMGSQTDLALTQVTLTVQDFPATHLLLRYLTLD